MTELSAAFVEETKEYMKDAYKKRLYLKERVAKQREDPEVALLRFLSYCWNSNGDEYLSVYELNRALNHRGFGVQADVLKLTFNEIIDIQDNFLGTIELEAMILDAGASYLKSGIQLPILKLVFVSFRRRQDYRQW